MFNTIKSQLRERSDQEAIRKSRRRFEMTSTCCYNGEDDNQLRARMLAQSISTSMKLNYDDRDDYFDHQTQPQLKTSPSQTAAIKTTSVKAGRARRRGRNDNLTVASLIIISLSLISLISLGSLPLLCEAQSSVVRPTKFTDVKTGDQNKAAPTTTAGAATSSQQAAGDSNATQDSIQKQPDSTGVLNTGIVSQLSPNTRLSNPFPQSSGQSTQSSSPSSITIYPVKTRLCSSSSGFRHDSPLGMQSYGIDDLSLSASSYSNERTGPQKARLNLDISGGAWCPGKPISGSLHGSEWIQVKLNRSIVITAIETQGRFGMGSGKEFTPGYSIEYSRNGGLSWHKWRDYTGIGVLRGNDDVSTPVKNELTPPIVGANVIRILPFSQHLRTVCMRFELHGCTYDEGAPIAYSGPDGVIEGRGGHLIDTTYDGIRHQGQLHGGLGQLVDGIKGADNFSHNQGLEWVGWKSKDGDLHLEFTFKTLRNFTGALFHSNNLFSSGVEALQAMDVHYGIDIPQSIGPLRDALEEPRRREQQAAALTRFGRQINSGHHQHHQHQQHQRLHNSDLYNDHQGNTVWSSRVLRIEYEPDKRLESARPVTVHLDHQLANRLKFVLKFASKWILISEVEFLSHPVELMSFASLSEQHTPPLLDSLKKSKSYDEYVAILREHQLRRIAANAFFGISPPPPPQQVLTSSTVPSVMISSEMPDPQMTADDQPASIDASNVNLDLGGHSINYQSIDSSTLEKQQQQSPYDNILVKAAAAASASGNGQTNMASNTNWLRDAANPASTSMFNLAYPGFFSPQPQPQPPMQDLASNNGMPLFDPIKRVANNNLTSANGSNSLGFVTIISLIIVAIILLVSILVALSRYHMNRRQPKLGFPGFPFNSTPSPSSSGSMQGGRKELGGVPIKGLVSPLMSVFSQNISSSESTAAGGSQQHPSQQDNQHPYQLEAYNTIFAPGHSTGSSAAGSSSNQSSAGMSVRNTLGRLANLGHRQAANSNNNVNSMHPHQLLVSVKDTSSSGKMPFGYQTSKAEAVSSQLIVGLNQANPLAHQQIYSNNNSSQQTYATQYTGSNASSSNCASRLHNNSANNQFADYNQYATPDLGGPLPTRAEILRSSCRAPNQNSLSNANHFHNNSFTLSNRFQQQQYFANNNDNNNNDLANMQHNYELINHDSDNSSSYQQQQQAFHSRTLSKQMRYNFNQQEPQNLITANGDMNAKKIIDLR